MQALWSSAIMEPLQSVPTVTTDYEMWDSSRAENSRLALE
jgi:hypothetical protein